MKVRRSDGLENGNYQVKAPIIGCRDVRVQAVLAGAGAVLQ